VRYGLLRPLVVLAQLETGIGNHVEQPEENSHETCNPQSVKFGVSPQKLFELYMDSKKHSAATNAPAKVDRRVGGSFAAFGGLLRGRNLLIVPNPMVVQAWRARHWKRADPDSILILWFSKAIGGGRMDLVQAGVPSHDHGGVRKGWPKYHWKPWKAYLARRKKSA
jgi:activator of HSP90 ATPase